MQTHHFVWGAHFWQCGSVFSKHLLSNAGDLVLQHRRSASAFPFEFVWYPHSLCVYPIIIWYTREMLWIRSRSSSIIGHKMGIFTLLFTEWDANVYSTWNIRFDYSPLCKSKSFLFMAHFQFTWSMQWEKAKCLE